MKSQRKRLLFFCFSFCIILLSCIFSGYLVWKSLPEGNAIAFTLFSPSIEKTNDLNLTEPLVIHFPKPVQDTEYRERIVFSPSLPFYAKWEENKTRLVLSPKTNWEPEARYTVTLPQGNAKNIFAGNPESKTFTFSTISHPVVRTIHPEDGTKNILLDIEDPIIVEFDRSTEAFWIDFIFSPTIETTFQNNEEKTRFEILPRGSLSPGSTYTLTVFSRALDDVSAKPKQLSKIQFTTALPPKELSKDPTLRLEQAKQFTEAQIIEGKYIDIHLESQIMTIFENGIALDAYLVSSGKRGMETPKGRFKVNNKSPRPWSKQYSLYMPYWMAITADGKYGIHELPEWPGGYKEGKNHLGTPVSHGCVRLGVGPAERVYTWADIGTPIVIH